MKQDEAAAWGGVVIFLKAVQERDLVCDIDTFYLCEQQLAAVFLRSNSRVSFLFIDRYVF